VGRPAPPSCRPEPDGEARQVDGLVEQVVDRVLEVAGKELRRQVHGKQPRVRVNQHVASHGTSTRRGRKRRFSTGRTPVARPQFRFHTVGAGGVFLQLR
jgi:hypothetical protein